MNKILLIGCGHMGSALLQSWYKNSKNIFSIIDPIQHKKIKKIYSKRVKTFKNINEIKNTKTFDIIILAVKPQVIEGVLKDFKFLHFKKNILIMSIIAGKKISFFKKFLPTEIQFVRAMPNMPASINRGITCLVSHRSLSKKNKIRATDLFEMVGKIVWLKNENDIDKITAVSGSGPAYFFLFIDLFQKAAFEIGLSKDVSKKLVEQTELGSIELLFKNKKNAEQLTNMIAIKGGTTEAAIRSFKKNNLLKKTIKNAVNSAFRRSKELGK